MKQGMTIERAFIEAVDFFQKKKESGEVENDIYIGSVCLQDASRKSGYFESDFTDVTVCILYNSIIEDLYYGDVDPYIVKVEYVDEDTPCTVYFI